MKLTHRPVILLGMGEAADAKRRLLERAGADIRTEEAADASLAIVAIEDEDEAQAAAERLKARGVLVNVVDRPSLCDFTLPAIVDRDPVLIAIGTGAASAGLAKALRQRLEALLPDALGPLAAALGRARSAMRMRWPDAATRRRMLDSALGEGALLDPFLSAGPDEVDQWLAEAPEQESDKAGFRLEIIPVTSADPDDLTLRATRLLGQADMVFHTADIAPAILHRARADARRSYSAQAPHWSGPGLALWLCGKQEEQA